MVVIIYWSQSTGSLSVHHFFCRDNFGSTYFISIHLSNSGSPAEQRRIPTVRAFANRFHHLTDFVSRMSSSCNRHSNAPNNNCNECKGKEIVDLVRKIEESYNSISHMKGENIEDLNVNELTELEHKIEAGIQRIKSEKDLRLNEQKKTIKKE
ncbi:hypothetical protein SUGI_1022990 [Cryptomeria japonica]|nr:hypothetical protein SUGI_1022990 [Cryptomeria japonica]